MESINITNARQNLYFLAEQAVTTSIPIKITSKKGDVVLLSEADYAALQETVYLLSVPGMRDGLLSSANEPAEECASLEDIGWDTE